MSTPGKDNWGDRHVAYHFFGEMLIGFILAIVMQPYYGFAIVLALVPGIVREDWKECHGYDAYSPSRLVADVFGAIIGVSIVFFYTRF